MSSPADPPAVTLRPVPGSERSELLSVLRSYLVAHADLVDPDRRHGDPTEYPYFDLYWSEPGRAPFWIEAGGRRAGFAMINDWSPSGRGVDHAVAEFQIDPALRRTGVGLAAAQAVFASRPGQWELQVHKANPLGMGFWPRAVAASGARDAEMIDLGDRVVHRFRI